MTYEETVEKLREIFTEFPLLRSVEKVYPDANEPNRLALKILTRSPVK